jgi:phosphoribosylformylglycinamidine synthase
LGETRPELGGSEYYGLHGFLGASVPRLESEVTIEAYERLTSAIDDGLVKACHDLSEGGLAVSAAEMAFTGGLGVDLELDSAPTSEGMRSDALLFSESNGRLLVEVKEGCEEGFKEAMSSSTFARIGTVAGGDGFRVRKGGRMLIELPLERLIRAWKTPLGGSR